jgi:hypothetical protein
LGFKHGTKGYVLLDMGNRNVFISHNVIFKENIFAFKAEQTRRATSDIQKNFKTIFRYFRLPP